MKTKSLWFLLEKVNILMVPTVLSATKTHTFHTRRLSVLLMQPTGNSSTRVVNGELKLLLAARPNDFLLLLFLLPPLGESSNFSPCGVTVAPQ